MPAQSWGDAERRAAGSTPQDSAAGGAQPGSDIRPEEVIDILVDRIAADAAVVRVRGEIDMFTTPLLRDALEKQFAQEANRVVVVDLVGVTFLASNGLAALVEAQRTAEASGSTLRLVGKSRAVTRPLESTGLRDVFALYDDVDSAL